MIIKADYSGYKVAEIPIRFKDRVYGESKLNLALEAPKFFIKLLILKFKLKILKTLD